MVKLSKDYQEWYTTSRKHAAEIATTRIKSKAVEAFLNMMRIWSADVQEIEGLLGVSLKEVNKIKADPNLLTPDQLVVIGNCLHIFRLTSNLVFSSGKYWVNFKNKAATFKKKTPLLHMASSLQGLYETRDYVDAHFCDSLSWECEIE